MADQFGFEKTFAAIERARGEITERLKSNDGGNISIIGKQRLAEAADRLAQLHRERDRIDGDIKLAERNLSEAKRLAERIAAPPSDKTKPASGKAAPIKVQATKNSKSK
jgi:hypothetical protein